jgi:hypothetical protein
MFCAVRPSFRDHVSLALQVKREAGDIPDIPDCAASPLPRYLLEKYCTDPQHISNKDAEGYESSLRAALADTYCGLDVEHVQDTLTEKIDHLQPGEASGPSG